ncbi:MAG: pyridoxamine 5'-phosphate oxidase family protein [Candidatus Methanomethylophilaceae archaeon]|jgi:predicted pyridoxine 5'-phosphate oxidase superfamily flavin-nucleotide-binding protein
MAIKGMSKEVQEAMEKQKIFPFATASKDGVPNVVPIGFLFEGRDGNIWVIDNYMDKSLKNVRENPKASFYIWEQGFKQSYQVKCSVIVEDSGDDYQFAVDFAHEKKETYPAKTLMKLVVDDVYYVTPGENAGKKL